MVNFDWQAGVKRQFEAAFEMVRVAVERCPEEHWEAPVGEAPFWHVAYHAVFFAHLYLSAGEQAFVAWEGHRAESQNMGPRPWIPGDVFVRPEAYSKAEVLAALEAARGQLEAGLREPGPEAASGFSWLTGTRFETHVYNLRHLQHHAGQLCSALRERTGEGVRWAMGMPLPKF